MWTPLRGLSPTISIDQKSASHNPRSTVGTVTEVHDYLRLLFARIGKPHCPHHNTELKAQSTGQIASTLLEHLHNKRVAILSPIVIERRGEYSESLREFSGKGFSRIRIDGTIYDTDSLPTLAKTIKHTIEIVVDRLTVTTEARQRLIESIDVACQNADGRLHVLEWDSKALHVFSTQYACSVCGYAPPELEPKLFSFNAPASACRVCDGLGTENYFDPTLIIEQPELSLAGGAIRGWDRHNPYHSAIMKSLAAHFDFDLSQPYHTLDEKIRHILLFGSEDAICMTYRVQGRHIKKTEPFAGIVTLIEKRWRETNQPAVKEELGRYLSSRCCTECGGARLCKESLAVKIAHRSIHDLTQLSLDATKAFFDTLPLSANEEKIASRIIREINSRLTFLIEVGLSYLSLDRSANTLSGGEAQRIRLASQIGSGLTGVTYVLDEPSIGLHQHDNARLLGMLKRLRDLNNTVLVVEHDEEAIRQADHVVDIGPGAGVHGGEVMATGNAEAISRTDTLTGHYLSGRKRIAVPTKRRLSERALQVQGARGNNLHGDDFTFPIGSLTCVTGVSGSGKSTLVNGIVVRAGKRYLYGVGEEPLAHSNITGWEFIDKITTVNQSPIGRTPRSNPATYTGIFTPVRECFAGLPLARERGYQSGRFSFNVAGGRCEHCEGNGLMRISMHFLPDVFVHCEYCSGSRYNRETLEVTYRGKSIADVLMMTVDDAVQFFKDIPAIARRLTTLQEVGLGYISLGQSATTLSGGEAQRVKLSLELSKRQTGKTLYILDEPTTGLHFHDINLLLSVLHQLVETGNTVIVIEHNLDVIKTADWVVDLGPRGGKEGGKQVVAGTPEIVAKHPTSLTGLHLQAVL